MTEIQKIKESKLETILSVGRKIIPKKIFKKLQPIYHFLLALTGALIYNFPSKKMVIIGVTGTKGKSSTTEFVNSILEASGYKTAIANTIRQKIGDKSERNMSKMTMRGRFFTQSFLDKALKAGCSHVVLEISSESVLQSRHRFIDLDALIFTNLSPEHIENHGSYENYVNAKVEIAKILEKTSKNNPVIIVNKDDAEAERFLNLKIKNKITYSKTDALGAKSDQNGSTFQIGKINIHSKLGGKFNIMNMLGAIAYAKFINISEENIKKGLEKIEVIEGRMEKLNLGQKFDVVIDYAHTPDSLKAIYSTYDKVSKICVLGNTGGGRDRWKRKDMAQIANEYCEEIILTNEDPYDEDPRTIVEEMAKNISKKVEIIMDRREAIKTALKKALKNSDENIAVLITGKGTDPYIMGPNGQKEPWDDMEVTKEELKKILDENIKNG